MNYSKEELIKVKFDNISNLEEKKKVASKIADKVKDGQVIRIWLRLNFIFSNFSNSWENKNRRYKYQSNTNFFRDEDVMWLFRNTYYKFIGE